MSYTGPESSRGFSLMYLVKTTLPEPFPLRKERSWIAAYHLKRTSSRSLFKSCATKAGTSSAPSSPAGWNVKGVRRCEVKTWEFSWAASSFLSLISDRAENTALQLTATFHNGFSAVGFWMAFLFLQCTNGKKGKKRKKKRQSQGLLRNKREEICPCIYYLFCVIRFLTFLNRFYSEKNS